MTFYHLDDNEPPAESENDLLTILKQSSGAILPYTRVDFKRGETILLEGENHPYFYLIEDGVVAMCKRTCREDSILAFKGPQEGIGFLHIEQEQVAPVSYTAISEVTAFRFERDYVRHIFHEKKETDAYLFQSARLEIEPILAREMHIHLPSDQKVLAGLLEIGEKFGRLEEDGSCLIPYYFTQKLLGNYLNLARAYIATNLRKLEEEGIVKLSPKPWCILQFEACKKNLSDQYSSTHKSF
ncbi:Crp/Fnr family transcriptional regulator [Listeria ilorinensis]|uniref:Crp/Fnr family transcriptional regulator n=1 Tax=Listeria ilorinensis TaxID=2867439 RepID=UPI001EF566AC|nr:Crp/Fnr family transcriptional regulator [Listeria ilorinensis]